jgi:hypothetical protein
VPHHWRPVERDEPSEEIAKPKFHGKDKDGQYWELREITAEEAREIERRPKQHDCERVLYP